MLYSVCSKLGALNHAFHLADLWDEIHLQNGSSGTETPAAQRQPESGSTKRKGGALIYNAFYIIAGEGRRSSLKPNFHFFPIFSCVNALLNISMITAPLPSWIMSSVIQHLPLGLVCHVHPLRHHATWTHSIKLSVDWYSHIKMFGKWVRLPVYRLKMELNKQNWNCN